MQTSSHFNFLCLHVKQPVRLLLTGVEDAGRRDVEGDAFGVAMMMAVVDCVVVKQVGREGTFGNSSENRDVQRVKVQVQAQGAGKKILRGTKLPRTVIQHPGNDWFYVVGALFFTLPSIRLSISYLGT